MAQGHGYRRAKIGPLTYWENWQVAKARATATTLWLFIFG